MKKTIRWTVGLLLAAACGPRTTSPEDFDKAVYTPRHASGFEILGAEHAASTLVRTGNPWQGAEGVERMLLIVRGDERAPDGFEGAILRGDAERVVCMSSTHIAMLDAVGAADKVIGVSGIDLISNARIAARKDKIGDVGYEGNVDYELLVALDPDLVLLYGVSGASPMEPKLRELGIAFAYVGDYLEESPLGKAEWMIAVAETVGRRTEAEAAFAPIPERYDALKAKVAAEASRTPSVMVNTPHGDSWFMPSTKSYVARLVSDAGADLVYKENTGNASRPVDLETAVRLASEADAWINTGDLSALAELKAQLPRFADVKCVREGAVWNCNRRTAAGGNDYWESGAVNPDRVLRDLIAIFHPEIRLDPAEPSETELYYYKRLE